MAQYGQSQISLLGVLQCTFNTCKNWYTFRLIINLSRSPRQCAAAARGISRCRAGGGTQGTVSGGGSSRSFVVHLDGIPVLGQPSPEIFVLRPGTSPIRPGHAQASTVPDTRVLYLSMIPAILAIPSRSVCWYNIASSETGI